MCTTACLPLQRYCQSAYTVTVCITPNTEHGLPHTSLVVVHVSFMVTWSEMKKLVRLGAAPRISFTEVTSQKNSTTNCCCSDTLCVKHLRTFSWYHDYDSLCMQQYMAVLLLDCSSVPLTSTDSFKTLISGGLGGCALWMFSFPLDAIKSRIQVCCLS